MKKSLKLAAFGVALAITSACTQQQADEIVAGLAFGLAKETVRLNPAVQNDLAATPAARTDFATLAGSGAATYTGSVAFYTDPNAIAAATQDALVDPDLMGRLDLNVDIGATTGTLTGEATNFVNMTGAATEGALTISDGRITQALSGQARIAGSIGGTLTGPTAAGNYFGTISGDFFDGDENLRIEGGVSSGGLGFGAFGIIGAATRD